MNHYVSLSLTNRKSSVQRHALTPRRDQLMICGQWVARHCSGNTSYIKSPAVDLVVTTDWDLRVHWPSCRETPAGSFPVSLFSQLPFIQEVLEISKPPAFVTLLNDSVSVWDFKFSWRRVWSSELSSEDVLIPDGGGSTYLWNVGRQLFYTAVHPRRKFWTSILYQLHFLSAVKYVPWLHHYHCYWG
jgi:hypothetical protein